MLTKGTGRIGIQRKNRDHQKFSIVKKGQNTETIIGDLKRLAVNVDVKN